MNDSETPASGQQVVTPCAFIHHNFDGVEKVFMARRVMTKKFLPGVYELTGGHMDFGEDIVVALKREIKEELGMDIKVGDPFHVFTYMNEIKGAQGVEVVYFATFDGSMENIRLNPEDHSEFKWATEEEFERISLEDRPADDPEISSVRKGFAILKGQPLSF